MPKNVKWGPFEKKWTDRFELTKTSHCKSRAFSSKTPTKNDFPLSLQVPSETRRSSHALAQRPHVGAEGTISGCRQREELPVSRIPRS